MAPDPDPAATLEEWQAITAAAPDGPWKVHVTDPGTPYEMTDIERGGEVYEYVAQDIDSAATARFIVTARAAMPALVAALRAVLKYHPQSIETGVTGEAGPHCPRCRTVWPCPEVEAITRELTGTDAGDG